jgi:pimeloyl-ACP methyl ester carboxylesterase/DNA-binding response OmpR family regulator
MEAERQSAHVALATLRRRLDLTTDNGTLLRTMRHELRTPVNHIIGYSEMLLEEHNEAAETTRRLQLTALVAAGKTLLGVINDSLATAERAREIDLELIQRRIDPPIEEVILTSQTAQQQLTEANTLDPAISDLQKIEQAARRLRALVAGEVPALTYEDLGSEAPPDETRGENGGHLLVVDDIAMNRDMLARRLSRLGYQISQAVDGREALAMLREQSYDLVLLDIMMPEIDGYQVLAAMKEDPELDHIPVIVLSALDHMESVVRCIEMGAEDYLPKPFDPVLLRARIGACLAKKRIADMQQVYLEQIEAEKKRTDDLLHVVIPIGVALTSERDFNQLLERIVQEAKDFCNADGGTLYLRTDDDKLKFVIVRNKVLNIAMGGVSGKDIPFAPLSLFDEAGLPIDRYVVTHAAHTGATINIGDAYNAEGYDFAGTRSFDQRTGYRSTSMLTIPLKDGHGRVIGVLQLINARDRDGTIIAFDDGLQVMIESLSALATAALAAYSREQQLRQEIADLRIEIDQVKKNREVDQIANSEYFTQLQGKARELRSGASAASAPRENPNELRTRIYVVNGQPIHVREQGRSNGKLMLMVHGWSSSWYAVSPLMSTFSDRYRCVAVDLPGYGESPPFGQRATIAAYADVLAGLIEQIGHGQPAVMVGHSMGGMISLTLALRHAHLVERLILLCPTISGDLSFWINTFISPITMLERLPGASRVIGKLERYVTGVTDRLMRPASFAAQSEISADDYAKLRADARRPGQGKVRAECYWAMRQGDLRGKLKEVSCPTLIIWGMEDNTVPLRDASVVANEWPAADLKVIPGAGHWPQFEIPEITRRHMRSFLATPLKLLKVQF